MQTNPQLELAENILRHTGTHLFLTGKAGTGKTTFLKTLREHSPKRMIVVAPTGVAAINAGGVTIHSFFQLSFAPFVPGSTTPKDFFRFNKEKINIIRSLDLLVIDEISMVRADLLDQIDVVLRHFRRNETPFGGVQLLMIGDLQQLAPIAIDEEWNLLREHYATPFFFNSIALNKTDFTCVELKTVYRQADENFIHLLNQVRENKVEDAVLRELNKRYKPNFSPDDKDEYITLTTHNAQANRINQEKLVRLNAPAFSFDATIEGKFPEYSYPTDAHLELKEGTQVMFVKNDPEKRFFNGKIGKITRIAGNTIEVLSKDESTPISVEQVRWENIKYTLDPETKELKEDIEGVFVQFPLRIAWAITIHKSQSLTFDRAVIDANRSFTHGQVYVALSRCKTLEGLVLSSPIGTHSIVRNNNVDTFIRDAAAREPDAQAFAELRKNYFTEKLFEQFSYADIQSRFRNLFWMFREHFQKNLPESATLFSETEKRIRLELLDVFEKFKSQLTRLLWPIPVPEEDPVIRERTAKGAVYFSEKTTEIFNPFLEKITAITSDNQEVRKRWINALGFLKENLRIKLQTLEVCREKGGFSVSEYLGAKARASIAGTEVAAKKPSHSSAANQPLPDILHPELFERLIAWRREVAERVQQPVFFVFPQIAVIGIANALPQNTQELLDIPGIGLKKVELYEKDVLQIVRESVEKYHYDLNNRNSPSPVSTGLGAQDSTGTKEQSFLMFKSGKTIAQISQERGLSVATIEGHLALRVATGEIPIEDLISPEKAEKIRAAFASMPDTPISVIKNTLGDDFSYGELRLVQSAG